jgi:hypothetical protein
MEYKAKIGKLATAWHVSKSVARLEETTETGMTEKLEREVEQALRTANNLFWNKENIERGLAVVDIASVHRMKINRASLIICREAHEASVLKIASLINRDWIDVARAVELRINKRIVQGRMPKLWMQFAWNAEATALRAFSFSELLPGLYLWNALWTASAAFTHVMVNGDIYRLNYVNVGWDAGVTKLMDAIIARFVKAFTFTRRQVEDRNAQLTMMKQVEKRNEETVEH